MGKPQKQSPEQIMNVLLLANGTGCSHLEQRIRNELSWENQNRQGMRRDGRNLSRWPAFTTSNGGSRNRRCRGHMVRRRVVHDDWRANETAITADKHHNADVSEGHSPLRLNSR